MTEAGAPSAGPRARPGPGRRRRGGGGEEKPTEKPREKSQGAAAGGTAAPPRRWGAPAWEAQCKPGILLFVIHRAQEELSIHAYSPRAESTYSERRQKFK